MPATDQKSIAVLPFVSMSADKADEYLSDGMTEELLNALAKVPGLRVPGRSSSFAFKGRTEDGIFRKVGEQLHVATVLEGSVRKAGDKLRITAQLINVADGFHLWSETYDGDMKDILSVQSDVAQRVVQALQVTIGVEATRALAAKPTENPEAHRLYLLGRYHFGKATQAGWSDAIQAFNQAIQLDPNYALAYCGLADNYNFLGGSFMPGKEAWSKEKDAAQKAVALDPNYPWALGTLGWSLLWKGDKAGALALMEKAQSLDAAPFSIGIYGYALAASGDRAKAEQILRDLENLAKQRYVSPAASMVVYIGLGEKEKALERLEKCYDDRDPQCWPLKVEPFYDSLRTEPRFQALVKKVFPDP